MYKTCFYIIAIAWIIFTACLLRSGGEFVPRIEFLEDRVQALYNMAVDNKNERIGQSYKTLTNLVKDYENGQEIISNYQTEQIEILRTQVNQLDNLIR